MSKIEIIRAKTDDEVQLYNQMTSYAFAPSPNRNVKEEIPELGTDYHEASIRYLLLENDIAKSTLHSIFMTQNVRGKLYDMQGIAGVSTYPEARKKGFVKKLMLQTFNDGYENGQVVTTLYPFRQSFYGRFGYINFPQARNAIFSPANLHDIRNYKFEGTIERYLVGEKIDRYYEFLQKYQKQQHGFAMFDRNKEQNMEKSKNWIVFAVVDGEDRGMIIFNTKGFEKEFIIHNFFYLDSNAKYLLLEHLSRHSDQFSEIKMRIFANQHPETWLFDSKLNIKSRSWVPSAMGRVLNVAKLSGMNVGHGQVSIKVTDEHCDWNNGNWKFTSNDGLLEIHKTDSYDIEMTIQCLSGLIYGIYSLDDAYQREWINSKNMNGHLEKLFPKQTPVIWAIF